MSKALEEAQAGVVGHPHSSRDSTAPQNIRWPPVKKRCSSVRKTWKTPTFDRMLAVSDTSLTIVRLDVLPADEADVRAEAVLHLLRELGAIGEPCDDGWAPGPRAAELLSQEVRAFYAEHRELPILLRTGWNHVSVHRRWSGYHAMDNFEAPSCPICGRVADPEDVHAGLDEWSEGQEPMLVCQDCGARTSQGDWVGQAAVAFGAPAVEFHSWEDLRPDVVTDLERALGGRTTWVRSRL